MRESSPFLGMGGFFFYSVRRRLHTHLFPLDSVCGRGLGLALPLHFVPEHDDLRLGRDDAHRVDV